MIYHAYRQRGAYGNRIPGLIDPKAVNTISPLDVSSLLFWHDYGDPDTLYTDAGSTLVSSDGDAIYRVGDKSANNIYGQQTTSTKRPLYKTSVKNNLSVARFDGADDFFSIPISTTSGSYTLFVVTDPDVSSGGGVYFIDSISGRLIFAAITYGSASNTTVGWYDGTWREIASATTGWQVLTFHLTSGGNGEIFRNGVSLGTAAYSSKNLSSTTAIGARYNGGASEYPGDIGEMILYEAAISQGDRESVESYLKSKWGI